MAEAGFRHIDSYNKALVASAAGGRARIGSPPALPCPSPSPSW